MKKIYFAGDIINNTGPAIVNKGYYKYLKNRAYFCKSNKKIIRIVHFLICFIMCKAVVVSGHSKFHLNIINISKIFKKRTYYIIHGDIEMESTINSNINFKEVNVQNGMLYKTDVVIAVSRLFSEYLKDKYSKYKQKIIYINNGVDICDSQQLIKKSSDRKKYTVMSVGGGIPQKNILSICKAIDLIKDINIKFIVVGKSDRDGDKIKQYDFVEYYEGLSHETLLEKMGNVDLYIQNSSFETFGLSIVEAVSKKCKVLISKYCGCIDNLKNLNEFNIIEDFNDINEIKDKIQRNLKFNNDVELDKTLNWEYSSKKLLEVVLE